MSSSPCHAVINIIAAQHHQNAAAKKKAAFDALYAMDNESDNTEDEGLAESLQKVKGRTLGDPTTSLSRSRRTPGRPPGSFARSISNMNLPLPQPKQQLPNPRRTKKPLELLEELSASNSIIKDTPPTLQHHHTITGVPSLDRSAVAMLPSSSAPPASSAIPMIKNKKGKGKQLAEIKLVPEHQRIFQNLYFCKLTHMQKSILSEVLTTQTSFQTAIHTLVAVRELSELWSMAQVGKGISTIMSPTSSLIACMITRSS
jgi:hypothetical protein